MPDCVGTSLRGSQGVTELSPFVFLSELTPTEYPSSDQTDSTQLRQGLQIREFYPEKNSHESKIKKEYGNKAYQDGKDIDALYFYTQVT